MALATDSRDLSLMTTPGSGDELPPQRRTPGARRQPDRTAEYLIALHGYLGALQARAGTAQRRGKE